MNSKELKILCLEDIEGDAVLIREQLREEGLIFQFDHVSTEIEYAGKLKSEKYDIILSDYNLPGFSGIAALMLSKKICPDVPFICVSGTIGEDLAVELMRIGASDYIMKDKLSKLPVAIERAMLQAEEHKSRIEAEGSLKESEARFRDIIMSSYDWVWEIDRNWKYSYSSDTIENILGYTNEEVIGKSPFDFMPDDEKGLVGSAFSDIAEKGIIKDLENWKIHKDEHRVCLLTNGYPIFDETGNLIGYRGVDKDITDRKLAEQKILDLNINLEKRVKERTTELASTNEILTKEINVRKKTEEALSKAKKAAEEANWAKSEFLANMSHEIRTPMNAVLGYADLLAQSLEDKTQKDYVESIKSSGRGLLTLINDILDLSKIEARKLELEFEYVNTVFFFSEFERIFSMKVSEKGLKLILEIASGTPAGLYVDETRLRQIIFNLIGNAIKFTEKGFVRIKVFAINPQIINLPKDKKEEFIDLIIEVEDSGIGISKEFQKVIFDPFTQQSGQKKYGGTGLGLAITKRLISLMNGTISLKSELNKGSTFRIKIPGVTFLRDFEQTTTQVKINTQDVIFGQAKIIVADDVESNRKYLIDALKVTDIIITEAENGQLAYLLARKIIPDLIITDIRMPVMNGFELLDKLKRDKKLKHIPVIAYSASVMKDQKEKIHRSGFAGFLIKPVQPAELFLELMNHLPYKSDKTSETDITGQKINYPEEINDLTGLINSLETTFMDIWKTFATRQPINEVEEFGKKLIDLGKGHNADLINKYGEELVSAVDSFNIKEILKLIKKYPLIIDELKDSAKKLEN